MLLAETVTEDVPVSPDTYVGLGYDLVKGTTFTVSEVKARVFKPESVKVVTGATDDATEYFVSDDLSKVSDTINASLGMKVSGFPAFHLDIKGNYNSTEMRSTDKLFTYINYNFNKSVETVENCSVRALKRSLTEDCREDLNDPKVSPREIVESYGTHVLTNGVIHGARFSYYVSIENSEHTTTTSASATMKTKIFKFDADAEFKMDSEAQELSKRMDIKVKQFGGKFSDEGMAAGLDASKMIDCFKSWFASLKDEKLAEEITTVKTVTPIWELADDESRQREIENYIMNEYIEKEKEPEAPKQDPTPAPNPGPHFPRYKPGVVVI